MVTTTTRQNIRGDFGLEVSFVEGESSASRIFLTLSDLIKSLEALDQTLINSIDSSIKPVLLLEDVEESSILIWLRTFLESVDDEGLKELNLAKIVGGYLVKAKYVIIDFLNKRTTIQASEEVIELQAELVEIAEETKTNELTVYNRVNMSDLLRDIEQIQSSLSRLKPGERIYYLTPSETVPFNVAFNIAPETIEDLATKNIIESDMEMILKIKTVDYLGQAKWEFKHFGKTISAKMEDTEWMARFRERQISLFPRDALRAIVKVITKYDFNDEVISIQYRVIRVIEVSPSISAEQMTIFDQEPDQTPPPEEVD